MDTIQCSACKKRFYAEGFKVNRLGQRLKTCLECNARDAMRRELYKCPHGRHRPLCRECSGSSFCNHDRRRNTCRDCRGVSVCLHDRLRDQCWGCNPREALWHRAHKRIYRTIGTEGKGGRTTEDILGCTKETFYHHIESLFVGEMSWARISEIDIDHRIPIEFGSPSIDEKLARLHYLNCQPLWSLDNQVKNRRYIGRPGEEVYDKPTPTHCRLTDEELVELLGF